MIRRRTGSYNVLPSGTITNIETAARHGLLEQVIKQAEKLGSQNSTSLNIALQNAALYGHEDVMEYLLKEGSYVDVRDSSGSTLLFNVVHKNVPKYVEVLLKHGADVNAQNKEGDTALHVACRSGKEDCLRILLSQEDINSIDVKNKVGGMTPLMIAAQHSFVFGVQSLTEKKCDVNLLSRSHKTALHYCLGKEVPLQHDQGRKVDAEKKLLCLKHLVHAGADVNCQDLDGFSPLHYAVKTDSLDCVRLLVDENCYLNQRGYFGQVSPQKLTTMLCRGDKATPITAFLLSVYYKNVSISRFLVQSGCEYYMCDFVLDYLTAEEPIYLYLLDVFQELRSLQKMCVMSVRQSIGMDAKRKVECLDIPKQLKMHICYPRMDVIKSKIEF